MFRKLLLSAAPVTSFSGVALADGGDSNIEQFMASQPHGSGISNGTPVIVDNRDGQPVIWYGQGSNGVSALAKANNGQSPVPVN